MNIELLSHRSKVFDEVDPRTVSAYVKQHVGDHEMVLAGAGTHAKLSHRQLSGLDLCHISYGSQARITSTSLRDRYHLQIMLCGSCVQRQAGQQRTLVEGDAVMINPHEPIDLTYSRDCEKFILKLPVALLDAVCDQQRWSRPAEGLRFASRVYKLHALHGMAPLLSLVCQEVEADCTLPSIQEHFVQIVTRKVLSGLATNLELKACDVHERSLQRVLTHIDEHLNAQLAPAALSKLANVSLRGLYLLFDQRVGVSPRRYILRRRLERIQATLLDPGCRVRSVTALALDYGFTHLGRFAAEYRAQCGELPSETLGRRSLARDA
ncbi:XylDLEGF operon transcriptional activator 1 [Pseudomonas reidholzensis]|uniref:XylDLEGF operon transcriptional activator 1 n=1 Tax=Pseudomonas reidholzensis TaxID=1785162 RepID=A0A383RZG8_9PSED|nr:helix-turn-helix domain-containing protein [Pseudomonas reidholzensis]SYX91841.1 XylDLEGF operon transcriptional activator 1 [Pseudomonas reidholzensis]